MAGASFADLESDLDAARSFLRSFALGQRGFTQQDGAAGLRRARDLCNRLRELFGSGPHAVEAAACLVSGVTDMAAAKARLALLRSKSRVEE
jgi:hypothetical protein